MNKKILIFIVAGILIAGLGVGSYFFLVPRCPESCDDGNPCTQDFCSPETNYQCEHSLIVGTTEGCQGLVETCKQYQCVESECQIVALADCCGNGKCEAGEDFETCSQDCERCDDGNPCTQDIYSYKTGKCSYIKIDGKQPGCSAKITCGSQTCKAGVCQIEYISNCCGNKICEAGETYETCSADCPSCDDKNECTIDEYDYHKHKCVNTPILDVICCGNGVCETGEDYENCAKDCPNCDDNNKCTKDSYDYHKQKCINEIIIPCCGNGICDEDTEEYSNCPTDCPNCDDNNELTEDSFNYTTQKCEHITPPSITVTSPSGGEKWIIGNTYEISWSCKNISENRLSFRYFVNIHLLQNDSFYGKFRTIAIGGMSGYAYHAISEGCVFNGTNSYSWLAGDIIGGAGPGDNFQVKIELETLEGALIVSDISEGYFTFIEP